MTNENLQDEQFCQAFELKAMADLLIRRATECWVPGFSDVFVEKEHYSRYMWVSEFVHDRRVLDIACGTGKGSFILAQEGNAREVVGCDLNSNAIKYASIRNKHPRVSFVVNDAQQFRDNIKYDVVVSFETIEHLPNVDAFLIGISELLATRGIFYVSTPISKKALDTKPGNLYHVQEWGFEEFQRLISKCFIIEDIYIQMRSENYSSILSHLKKKVLTVIERDRIRIIKKKYLSEKKIMRPIKYENSDSDLFKNAYGIAGYQILVVRK
jgi:2-polyprenyl-3-methyl-5-hydroxy-6-metoxy-1,4-benzoquinol methylase